MLYLLLPGLFYFHQLLLRIRKSGNLFLVEPLSKGKIQIQSEGGELFVRNIRIRPIDQIPDELLK